ncbi:MAG TPA: Sec-independent protein translocase protein TatB [Novosphingobium sp.]|nr:Sec-independent protein translocase protein TatB [Novosphingobium sp.]
MLDIAPSEMLLTLAVAVVVIGPKDMPRALRTAGRWIGKMRRVSGHFRAGLENMIREAEMEEMERKWREQNAAIMAAHPPVAEPAALTGPAPDAALAGPASTPTPAPISTPAPAHGGDAPPPHAPA